MSSTAKKKGPGVRVRSPCFRALGLDRPWLGVPLSQLVWLPSRSRAPAEWSTHAVVPAALDAAEGATCLTAYLSAPLPGAPLQNTIARLPHDALAVKAGCLVVFVKRSEGDDLEALTCTRRSPMTMPNIHVQRYASPSTFAGNIEPEDRSWIVFVAVNGEATFWRRSKRTKLGEKTEHVYVDAELPTHVIDGIDTAEPSQPPPPWGHPGPLDFTIEPATGPGDQPGFFASLNVRAIACWGETEHDATRGLLNYVASLCTAGALDHTGQPTVSNPRRYAAVFGGEHAAPEPAAR